MATQNIAYGTYTAMTVTGLQSLGSDTTTPFVGWQSDRVDNRTTLALDYEVQIKLSTAATAPASPSIVVAYVVPWVHDGSTWTPAGNLGSTTRPTGSEGTATVADPNSMKWAGSFPYYATSQPIDGWFTIAGACGGIVPDGWSIVLCNETGAALGTGCVVAYRPITATIA